MLRTFNNVTEIPAVENAAGGGFFLFKSGLKPAVEDEGNQNGRRYRIEFPSDTPIDKIAQHWEDLVSVRPFFFSGWGGPR